VASVIASGRKSRDISIILIGASLWGALLFPLRGIAADYAYLAELQERARREQLANRPEWRQLLHYKSRLIFPGVESMVDNDAFFLSAVGRHNPQAELDATLASFFRSNGDDAEQSTQCTFVARYNWLKQQLGFDSTRLPELTCRRFHRWMEQMNADGLTLVFPSAYLNNPASMFGHTLLRVDARGQDEQTRLLANTINFAADSGGQRGVAFAFKGLFGKYQGKFSAGSYYFKVKTYGDIENRDIWEYRLRMSSDEIDRLLQHAWEMRVASFDYYFVDENCSYHLLSLLDNARPELGLTDRFSLWAIPSETVRSVADAGMIDRVNFRAARSTVLQERARLMEPRLQELARRLANSELEPHAPQILELDIREQAQVVELAVDYVAYRQPPRAGSLELPSGLLAQLLEQRSRIPIPDQTPTVIAPAIPPGAGHKPARFALGYGFDDRRRFVQFDIGPGYHDQFDPEGGFTRGARINALLAAVRYYPEDGNVELERLDVVDIMSLSPWGRFLQPASWKLSVGVARKRLSDTDRPLMGRFKSGVGISHDFTSYLSAHAFAEGTVEGSDRFTYFLAPGIGPGVGVLLDVGERWRNGLFFRWQQYFLNECRGDFEASWKSRFTLERQSIVGLELEWKRESGYSFPAGRVYWQIYF